MKSEPSRTFIGSVLCVDLVGYSKRTVDEQIEVKSAFNHLLSQVIKGVRPDDRIILDTGDGAAVTFLGDPDECLKVGLELRDRLMEAAESLGSRSGEGPVRIGMNLGPLRVALDMNGHPNIIGDGLIAAERVMAFAQPGQIVASRGFHEMVSRISVENGAMFHYEGKHTDKNAREHDIYIVEDRRRVRRAAAAKTAERRAKAVAELQAALDPEAQLAAAQPAEVPPPEPVPAPQPAPAAKPAAIPRPTATPKSAPAIVAPDLATHASEGAFVAFLRSPWKVWTTAIVLLALIFAEAMMLDRKLQAASEKVATAPASEPLKGPPAIERKPAVPEPKPTPVETKPQTAVPASSLAPKIEPPKSEPPKSEPPKPEPPPRKSDPPPPQPVTSTKVEPAPTKTERAKPDPAPAKSERPKPELDPRMATAKPATPAPAPHPEPAPPPATAPTTQAPPAAPTQVATAATPVTRVPVQFPKAAAQQGLESGTVRARLAINADGRVTQVTVLGSSSRLFDREAIRALEEWRFNAGAAQRSYEVEIEFKR
jgi:TonB family protein